MGVMDCVEIREAIERGDEEKQAMRRELALKEDCAERLRRKKEKSVTLYSASHLTDGNSLQNDVKYV